MDHEQQQLAKLVTDIYATDPTEIHCETAGDLMVLSAEADLTEAESRQQYPALWRHFQVCADCRREYQMMVDLIQLERSTQMATLPVVPPAPMPTNNRSFWQAVGETMQTVFGGFDSALPAAVSRGESLGVEPVTVLLADGLTTVEVDVEANERDAEQRDLFCHVERVDPATGDPVDESALEATPIWLQVGDDGPILAEQALDDFGDTFFTALAPGGYTLWLRLRGQVYAVHRLLIP